MSMQWYCLLLPAVACLALGDTAKKPPADAERIQGVWTFTSSQRAGKAENLPEGDFLKMEFAADAFRFHLPAGARHAQPYKLDSGRKPKTIDWLAGGRNGPSEPLLGIYELDGDILRICWGKKGQERPTEFKTATGAGDWLWVLKRLKPE
jgi:uncharacterized protein (TIGR03067 family)